MRTNEEVKDELGEVREGIKASLKKIEQLKVAENAKAILAERERLAEMRRVGRRLLHELEAIGKQTDEANTCGRV